MIQKTNHRVEDEKNLDRGELPPAVERTRHPLSLSTHYDMTRVKAKYCEVSEFKGVKHESDRNSV